MNKSYKSIWNEALGTYVAAAETASASGRKSSSSRKVRRAPTRAHAGQLALEQRIVFDAAIAATLVEVQDAPEAAHDPLFEDIDQLAAQEASSVPDASMSVGAAEAPSDANEGVVVDAQPVVESEAVGEAATDPQTEAPARAWSASNDRAIGAQAHIGNVLDNDDAGGASQGLAVVSFTLAGDSRTYEAGDSAIIEGVGSLVIHADGSYEFTPVEGYEGDIPACTYIVSDGNSFVSASLTFALVSDASVHLEMDEGSASSAAGASAEAPSPDLVDVSDGPTVASDADALVVSAHVDNGLVDDSSDSGSEVLYATEIGVQLTPVEVVFVDSDAYEQANVADLPQGEVYILDATRDGIEQIAEVLSGRTGIHAIHIVSHGSSGQLNLGSTVLSSQSASSNHADELAIIGASLSLDGDILLYGCDVAAGDYGGDFLRLLAAATGADVAASSDSTGAVELGGDWVLEAHQGDVEAQALVLSDWQSLLATSISITDANILSMGAGFTVEAFTNTGAPTTVSVRNGSPSGFGVTSNSSGDSTEIGEINGAAERLQLTFDGNVTNINVWLAWQAPSETALVLMYQGNTLVGTWTRVGGSDTVDGPFSLSATGGVAFNRVVFTVPVDNASVGDDYLVNRVDFVLSRPPQAQNDSFSTSEDVQVSGSLFSNNGAGVDSDPDGDIFTVTSHTNPSNGVVVVNSNGTFNYTPNANFNGVDTFTYTITDIDGRTSTAAATINVIPVNDPPVDGNETNTVTEDATRTVADGATGDLLNNATDIDGGPLSITGYTIAGITGTQAVGTPVAIAGVGSVTINANGSYSFTPLPNFDGAIPVITYTVTDGQGGTDTSTLTLTMVPVNDAPQASDDGPVSAPFDTPASGNVLPNDTDPDGDPLSVTEFTVAGDPTVYPAGSTAVIDGVGTLVIGGDGGYTFTPLPGYVGPVPSAVYTVSDGQATDTAVLSFADVASPPPLPGVTPPAPTPAPAPAPAPVPVQVVPDAPGWENPQDTLVPPQAIQPPLNSALHVLYAVNEAHNERDLFATAIGGIQGNPALQGEALGQLPDSLIFSAPERNLELGLIRERARGEIQGIRPALHVQNAVRHQPIETDHALYVQHAVRSSQLESGIRSAAVDALNSATPGYSTLFDSFALGAPAPLDTGAKPVEAEAPAAEKPAQKTAVEQRDQPEKGIEQADEPAPFKGRAEVSRPAPGFRSQLERLSKDRSHGARPVTRITAKS